MDYAKEQYDLMEKLSKGIDFDSLAYEEQQTLIYLDQEKIVQANAQIRDGYYTLSPRGKQVLAAYQEKQAEKVAKEWKEAQELADRKSERDKQKRQAHQEERRHRDNAQLQWDIAKYNAQQSAAQQSRDHHFQWQLSVFQTLLSVGTGALLSNLDRLIDWIASFF